MVMPHLDAPFAASRRYPGNPMALAFDILTLPLQLSNTLTGVPPIEIPAFGQSQTTPSPEPAPTPAPAVGAGIQGTFGVVGLVAMPPSLGLQSITVGTQPFQTVRVTWTGQIRNTGNVPLAGATVRLQTLFSPSNALLREASAPLSTIAPGATAPINLAVDLSAADPPGSFVGNLLVEQAGGILGHLTSMVLGTINPVIGIAIEGTFGI